MKYRQIILPEAQRDFDEAVEWHSNEKKGLGKKFTVAIKKELKRIRKMPMIRSVVAKDVRKAIVPGFQYVIFYRVVDTDIFILSIFHAKRDPSIWQSRI